MMPSPPKKPARALLLLLAVAAVPLVGWADVATGADIAFTLLYLLPIAGATWFGSRRAAILVALACAGSWFWGELTGRAQPLNPAILAWNCLVEAGVFLMFVLLLAWLRDRLETEKRLARTDPLTGLANRRAFLDAARVELERARRLGHSITLACFDLDGFKTVNDRLGHRAGDELLCLVATRLREAIRVFDLPARLGGDEFMLLLPGLGADGAPRFLERLKAEVIDPLRARWSVSWSCGAATYLSAPFAVEEMIASADRLMYAVKGSGKDGVLHEVDPTPDANPGSAAERLPSIEDASPAGVADAPQTER